MPQKTLPRNTMSTRRIKKNQNQALGLKRALKLLFFKKMIVVITKEKKSILTIGLKIVSMSKKT